MLYHYYFAFLFFWQVQNYCASWALPPRDTFLLMDERNFYSRVHVHATQMRERRRPGTQEKLSLSISPPPGHAYQNQRTPIKLKPF